MSRSSLFCSLFAGWLALVLVGCGNRIGTSEKAPNEVPKEPPKEAVDASSELQLDYAILLDDASGLRRINEKFRFHSGDRLRLQVRPGFAAHLYLFNRAPGKNKWTCLYPGPGAPAATPLVAGKTTTLPEHDSWFRVDGASGVEYIVLIASAYPLSDFTLIQKEIDREDFEARVALLERDFRPSSSRRFEDKDWVKLFASRGPKTVIVQWLPLDHR